ncbi:MAG TPA: dienelactone hydrolase family protein [Candidatus Binataceae bacterium]|nr:dienelactone hydrolase family protein [Candidatus Binataceae bacterium]
MNSALLSAAFVAASILFSIPANAGWIAANFTAGGMPVNVYQCVPDTIGAHPAVIMLHGASGNLGHGYGDFEKICTDLAAAGYFTEFIEYYSQTGAVGVDHPVQMMEDFPVWLAEIKSGIDALDKNPAVDPHRVAMVGYSLGAFLSLATGASQPHRISAVVEYYGGLPIEMEPDITALPPTLIIHGEKDSIVPVAKAHELDALMTKYNRPHEMVLYPDANHAFNFPGLRIWYNAADAKDSWTKTLNFLAANLKNPAANH